MRSYLLYLFLCMVLVGCGSTKDLTNPKPLRNLCEEWGGVPLVIPDSRFEPGSIIRVEKNGKPSLIDDLRSCPVPQKVLILNTSKPFSVNTKKTVDVSAGAVLVFEKGIEAGPEFSKVSTTKLDVSDVDAQSLKLILLMAYLERNRLSSICDTYLKKPDHFVVTETLRVAGAKYELIDKAGVGIKLDASNVSKFVKASVSGKVSADVDGSLVVKAPAVVCIKRAVWLGGSFDVLAAPTSSENSADAKIGEYYDSVKEIKK